ncbi:hypothetical protein KOI35_08515 [Actinoplanes bogorensis]|uniref:WXG100 family type VII secretion target n=1 Tax=Paractinoplanes bogorensis TaxID=1610840 RepID=A0ABS5YKG7_9ACTN|nr:hypothetical protein [Actinoplanes bogorensis]MBU2663546.1 hypothetical protein [Actinoplanes bogorensis]
MTSNRLRLDADEALAGSRALSAAGEDLHARRNRTGAEIATASAATPWGRDQYGRSFEQHYRPFEEQVLEAWQQLADYVAGLGDAAAQSVHDNVHADARAARRFRS